MDNGPSQKMKFKLIAVVGGFVTLSFIVLAIRIIYIACFAKINGVKYKDKAYTQQLSSEKIKANRGTIYDRNMIPLAQSATVWTVSIAPNEIKNKTEMKKIVRKLSSLFPEIEKEKIIKKCNAKTKYEIIKKQCEKDKHDDIINFMEKEKIYSMHLTDDTKRYNPNNDLASHVIGFCGADNQGLLGLELFYDRELRGTDGKQVSIQNGIGTPMPYNHESYYPPKNGYNLITTIDADLQRMAQKVLETHCNYRKPLNRGLVIIMDATNSEILALAIWPSFNLNEPFELPDIDKFPKIEGKEKKDALNMHWKNKAISELYEPGSTFKVVTLSDVLEEGLISLEQKFHCTGSIKVGPEIMHCWRRMGHGLQDVQQVLTNSCNPAFISMGTILGPHKFFQYFESFGFTSKTNIDLVGEANPIYIKEKDLGIVELASESFGQSAAITPMHMIKAFSTIMNNGYDSGPPHLMKQIVDENGNNIKTYKSKNCRQVISKKTAETMQQLLVNVVNGIDNKGTNASVLGHEIAGKSGTAQKLHKNKDDAQGEDSKERYVPSFIACVDHKNHPITMMALLDSPVKNNEYYGGVCAAPMAGEIAKNVLQHYNISPNYNDEELEKLFKPTPKCESLSVQEARDKLFANDFRNFEFIGHGNSILRQIPFTGTRTNKNTKIMLYTEDISDEDKVTVPDVIGLNQDQANSVLANNKLNMQISNNLKKPGRAIAQNPEPGTTALKGHIVDVTFVMHDDNQD